MINVNTNIGGKPAKETNKTSKTQDENCKIPYHNTTDYHHKEKFLGDQISPQIEKTTAKTQCDNKDTKSD